MPSRPITIPARPVVGVKSMAQEALEAMDKVRPSEGSAQTDVDADMERIKNYLGYGSPAPRSSQITLLHARLAAEVDASFAQTLKMLSLSLDVWKCW